ncbi:hypothetical protein HDU96_006267 [Phlyctochytrium bullatum]|nr:hypothetical protein HDU96_006267 [Phlyctochytrium bullatum]
MAPASTSTAAAASTATGSLPASGRAFVKSVLSGDTVILRGRPVGGPPPEKVLSLANIIAPRLGTPSDPGKEESGAYESREFLRKLLVGKEVAYRVEYTTNSNNRDFGTISLQPPGVEGETNLTKLVVKSGWAKVKQAEGKRAPSDEQVALHELEAAAQAAKLGLWAEKPVRNFSYNTPDDPRAFLEKFKGKQVDGVVDQVRDGSSFRVSLIYEENGKKFYQYVTLSLTGIKAPVYRVGVPNVEDLVEPYSEEAKFFVESRILQRDVKVVLEGVNSNGTFVGTLLHPAGNISEALLAEGYATILSWNIALVTGGPAKLKAAELRAKDKKLRVWKNFVAKSKGPATDFDAVVIKINAADSISVVPASNPDAPERKITLASLRSPKPKDEKEAFYNHEAKELLRQRLIGKTVHVSIDYVKPAEGAFEEKECATVLLSGNNIAELLISRGLGWAIRHRKDDDNRASNYDALLLAEDKAQKATKGVHSTKEAPPLRIADASENAAKAKQFLPFLMRSSYLAGVVDFVASGSRFKIWIPSQNTKITLVLAGIRTPKPGRLSNEKPEAFGPESLEFATRKVLQRDVEILVEGADKVGGFIGNLFIPNSNGRTNFAALLLEAGFATVHDYSASQSKFSNELYTAEKVAQEKRAGIWSVRDPVAEAAAKEAADALANDDSMPVDFREVYVSDIADEGKLALQFVGPDLAKLEKLLSDFAAFHGQATSNASVTPKAGDYVSAKFSADETWYRARVRTVNDDKTYTVVFIDYGNVETVSGARLRPLDPRFSVVNIPAFAKEARLAFVTVPKIDDDYGDVAFERLREETEGKKMVVRVVNKAGDGVHHVILQASKDAASVNELLITEGIATVERPVLKRFEKDASLATAAKGTRKAYIGKLIKAQNDAKSARLGLWRYGDFMGEDDL